MLGLGWERAGGEGGGGGGGRHDVVVLHYQGCSSILPEARACCRLAASPSGRDQQGVQRVPNQGVRPQAEAGTHGDTMK
jgi:hypothetical protein